MSDFMVINFAGDNKIYFGIHVKCQIFLPDLTKS